MTEVVVKESTGSGIGFTGMLTIVFIAFKLAGIIDWSWFWVLSPIWFSLLFVLVVIVIAGTVAGTRAVKDAKKRRNRL